MRTLFIVNPAAGHGRGRRRWESAARRLGQGDWQARWTEGPGHGRVLARVALEQGFSGVVAVGGDGTAGEVVDGFLAAPESVRAGAALGTWPSGSGCDLARHLRLRPDIKTLQALLARSSIRRLDAGVVECRQPGGGAVRRHFLNVVSFGVAGEVALGAQEKGKPFGGTLSYLLSSLGALLTTPPRAMELVADGQPLPRGRYHLVSVANTSTTGGGMIIAPGADAEDGFLDLVAVGDMGRWELLRRFPEIYRGTHLRHKGVSRRLIRRLEARSSETVRLNIDGEAMGLLPAVFEVMPKAVPFLLPA